jgi:hypothetical protein
LVKPNQGQSSQIKPNKVNQGKSSLRGWGGWPKLGLAVAKEAGGTQAGQTQSNRVNPVNPVKPNQAKSSQIKPIGLS